MKLIHEPAKRDGIDVKPTTNRGPVSGGRNLAGEDEEDEAPNQQHSKPKREQYQAPQKSLKHLRNISNAPAWGTTTYQNTSKNSSSFLRDNWG
eukprot:1190077-Amphidinium_carterae.1